MRDDIALLIALLIALDDGKALADAHGEVAYMRRILPLVVRGGRAAVGVGADRAQRGEPDPVNRQPIGVSVLVTS